MPSLRVSIARFVDDHQPGFVECIFTDAEGVSHSIIEKVPVISEDDLRLDSGYPRDGEIECTLLETFTNALGEALARIDTELPYHIESTRGVTVFVVCLSQLASGRGC